MNNYLQEDLKKAKPAEWIVRCVLASASLDLADWKTDWNIYYFDDKSDEKKYWHIGDIECTDSLLDETFYIDVKDDGMISKTGNIFAEDNKIFKSNGKKEKGFMRNSEYDYVAVISQPDNKIYMLDFKEWKKYYRQGKYVTSYLSDATCYGFVMPIWKAKRLGIIKYEIDYIKIFDWWLDDKGKKTLPIYESVKVERVAS